LHIGSVGMLNVTYKSLMLSVSAPYVGLLSTFEWANFVSYSG